MLLVCLHASIWSARDWTSSLGAKSTFNTIDIWKKKFLFFLLLLLLLLRHRHSTSVKKSLSHSLVRFSNRSRQMNDVQHSLHIHIWLILFFLSCSNGHAISNRKRERERKKRNRFKHVTTFSWNVNFLSRFSFLLYQREFYSR